MPQAPRPWPPTPQRHGRVALLLGGIPRTLKARRPETVLAEDASLGRRLAVRRRELGHRMVDAAALAGVDAKTWMWWERDEREPVVNHYPAIIRYLGYEPWPEPASLGEELRAQRRRRGLSIKLAAEVVCVDEGTFGRWERGEWVPQSASIERIEGFIGTANAV